MEDLHAGIMISKEEVAKMPQVEFKGKISVITNLHQAHEALEKLSQEEMVGFDTETRPNFQKGQNHTVALVQIATMSHSYLFRVNKLGFCSELISFLENEGVKKIGLSTKDDFFNLRKLHDLTPGGFVELQDEVKKYGIGEASLQKIYAILLSGRISKGQRLSNWEADKLTPAQQAYASIDAWACLKIYKMLQQEGFDPASSPYNTPSGE